MHLAYCQQELTLEYMYLSSIHQEESITAKDRICPGGAAVLLKQHSAPDFLLHSHRTNLDPELPFTRAAGGIFPPE